MICWIELIFACQYQYRKAKISLNNFKVSVVKNGRGLLGYGPFKSALSQESRKFKKWHSHLGHGIYKSAVSNDDLMNWADFLNADTSPSKLKVTLIVIGCLWSNMGMAIKFMGF